MRIYRYLLITIAAALVVPVAASQRTCHTFTAMNTQTLLVDPYGNGNWVVDPASFFAVLDEVPLNPVSLEYIPGSSLYPSRVAGLFKDFTQQWNLNGTDTFTVTDYHSSFPLPIGKAMLGMYTGTGKVTAGKGLFEGGTGMITETGPYMIWFTVDEQGGVWTHGKYNALYTTKICVR